MNTILLIILILIIIILTFIIGVAITYLGFKDELDTLTKDNDVLRSKLNRKIKKEINDEKKTNNN